MHETFCRERIQLVLLPDQNHSGISYQSFNQPAIWHKKHEIFGHIKMILPFRNSAEKQVTDQLKYFCSPATDFYLTAPKDFKQLQWIQSFGWSLAGAFTRVTILLLVAKIFFLRLVLPQEKQHKISVTEQTKYYISGNRVPAQLLVNRTRVVFRVLIDDFTFETVISCILYPNFVRLQNTICYIVHVKFAVLTTF